VAGVEKRIKERYNLQTMTIRLFIEENNFIKLCLFAGKKRVDCFEWQDKNDLSRAMLANLDKMLRKNKLALDKIAEYKIISKVPRKWTTVRIAEITFGGLQIAGVAQK
jgi:hypothetical protein